MPTLVCQIERSHRAAPTWSVLLLFLLACIFPFTAYAQEYTSPQPKLETQAIGLSTASGKHFPFTLEIARTPAEKTHGLMFRTELAANEGMLFVFGHDYTPMLWMKNTLIPLDMVFTDHLGKILYIQPNTTPHSLTPIGSGEPAWGVIELQGGITEKLGISVGDRFAFPPSVAR